MRSFEGWKLLVAGCVLGRVSGAVLPTPVITPAPQSAETEHLRLENRQVDPISLAQVLLTALPLSLRLIAATNVPVVSSILWRDFLDDNKPDWFLNLPGDIQSYLIAEFGPETAWPTAAPSASDSKAPVSVTVEPSTTSSFSEQPSSSAWNPSITSSISGSLSMASSSTASSGDFSSGSISQSITSQPSSSSLSRVRTLSSTPFPSATANLEAPALLEPGLSRTQKIGLGVGVPLALLAFVALLFACCILYRRRNRKHVNGNEPPSSPGFIPRFSFQDRGLYYENREHHAPLNPVFNNSSQNVGDTNWEDDDYEHTNAAALDRCNTFPPATAPPPMATQNPFAPIMAPALFHTHSSNRARGTRLSYTSLHAVAEVSEPDEDMLESPILGRRQTRTGPRRPSLSTNANVPSSPLSSTIKRKPVPNSPIESPAASIASRSFLRPPLEPAAGDSGSSSSGLAVSSISSNSGLSYESESPISPVTRPAPRNPFAGGYDYLEDYGPEYSNNGYLDHEDGAYGGHRSLDRYPEASPPPCSLKTEWPLRNVMGSGHRRNRSPMWDRVYER